jgi:hypothetical protein
MFGKGKLGGTDPLANEKQTTALRQFFQSKSSSHFSEDKDKMTDRDWRLFREENQIIAKTACPPCVREWSELPLPTQI